jgi:deazaflavin-dependent oxidoreductase (nitroreductase family)
MGLYYVDPHQEYGRWYRLTEKYARTRPVQFIARHTLFHIDPWLYRVTRGRYPRVIGGNITAPLVSIGAKSGLRREHQLTYFHDGPDPILVASNSGGPKHPQWYHNLKANAECEFGFDRFVAAEVTDPADYERLFALAENVFGGYADYRVKTAAIGRHIPVFRLTPR